MDRVVFPFQLVVAAAIATLRRVDATDSNPTRRRRRAARFAVAHVVLSHGVPTAAALLAAIIATAAFARPWRIDDDDENETNPRVGRVVAPFRRSTCSNPPRGVEDGGSNPRGRSRLRSRSRAGSNPAGDGLDILRRSPSRGCLGNTTFDGYRAARYCALRALSSALDAAETVRDENDADANSLDAVVAYVLHPATYQAGPLVPFAAFRGVFAEASGSAPVRVRDTNRRDHRVVRDVCALTRIGYVPAATFHGARFFADDEAAAAFEERLLPFGLTQRPRRRSRFSPSRGPRLTSSSAYPGRCLRTWMAYSIPPATFPRSGPPPRPRFEDTGARST